MAQLLATFGPRVVIPTFFVGQKISKMTDPAAISQTIAFSALFVTAVVTLFQGTPWLAVIPGVAAVAYYKMLNDPTNVKKYRYADWAITTPIMLTAILLANKNPIGLISVMAIADLVMILAGYMGTQTTDDEKMFKYFCLSCLAFLPILYILAIQKGNPSAVYLTLGVWLLYPVIYYLKEINMTTEENTTIYYSVMDMIAKIGIVHLLHF